MGIITGIVSTASHAQKFSGSAKGGSASASRQATSLVESSTTGPLKDLENNGKFNSTSLRFPLDVTGPEQGHFIRFNIFNIDGSKFASESPRESPQSDTEGNALSASIGGAIGAAIGGGTGGAIGSIVGSGADKLGLGGLVEGVSGAVGGALQKVNDAVGSVAGSIVDKIPLAEDALSGVGSFPGSIGQTAQIISQASGRRKESIGDIVLYMPMSVAETYQTVWTTKDVGFAGQAFLETGKAWDDLKDNYKTYLREAGSKVVGGMLGGDAIGALELKTGRMSGGEAVAVNPHVEFFFENVNPRTFTFDFKMSPRNIDESRAIQQIVKTFKYHSAPEALGSGAGRYWKYPQVFEIEYWNSDITHKIAECALTQVAINYTGMGDNHTFYDGSPIQTDITLNFQELDIITKDHIEKGF